MNTHLQKIIEHLQTPSTSILTLHRNPDGDSIGSNLALYEVLKSFRHTVHIYSNDPVPQYLQFLPSTKEIITRRPSENGWNNYKLYWALDMRDAKMIGDTFTFPESLKIISIDHHITENDWGNIWYRDSSAISTTILLYRIFLEAQIDITPDIATCLLTGLATDSGFFSHAKSSEPFTVTAKLIDLGARYEEITTNIQKNMDFRDIQFISYALGKAQIFEDKKALIIAIPYEDWIMYVNEDDKSSLLKRYIQSINGTDVGITIIEKSPKKFRISFRSRNPEYDVNQVASKIGGGGHKNASGAYIEANSVENAIQIILNLL
ncbi:MAG: bifunctional oligoribonuclease/PAP phosphatase NrnA [Candidatus Roizmanbacteria bacterium]